MATRLTPDPTFYPTPKEAKEESPHEEVAYLACHYVGTDIDENDFLTAVDVDPDSDTYGEIVGRAEVGVRDELHHFCWEASSNAFSPYAVPNLERRHLIVPGLRSSNIYIVDTETKRDPTVVKELDGEDVARKTGHTKPHTVHCGPENIYVSALGGEDGADGPGGIFLLDHGTFEPEPGSWVTDLDASHLTYDLNWHLSHDTAVTSEWTTPQYYEDGFDPADLEQGRYGNELHFWNLRNGNHEQAVELDEYYMPLSVRSFNDPTEPKGFVNTVLNGEDLSSAVWFWYHDGEAWDAEQVIEYEAHPADPAELPPILEPFEAIPPLAIDLNLSIDDQYLYVQLWGTGELRSYDVSDPFDPELVSTVELGGIYHEADHPSGREMTGAPCMSEISLDGDRIYLTNSLYSTWDNQFYPEGIDGCLVLVESDDGELTVDEDFFVEFDGARVHQTKLDGGDCVSETFCYPPDR